MRQAENSGESRSTKPARSERVALVPLESQASAAEIPLIRASLEAIS